MTTRRATIVTAVSIALFTLPTSSQAQPAKPADPPFKMECASASVKFLPKGNAGVGSLKFTIEVDPAARKIRVGGEDRPSAWDKYEVWFKTPDEQVVSISRSTGTFRYVAPIKGGSDSRLYLLFEGTCKLM